jgi:hypothetical protein
LLTNATKDFAGKAGEALGTALGRAFQQFQNNKFLRELKGGLEDDLEEIRRPQPLNLAGVAAFTGREASQLFDPMITVQKEQVREQQKTTQGIRVLQNIATDTINAIQAGLGFR